MKQEHNADLNSKALIYEVGKAYTIDNIPNAGTAVAPNGNMVFVNHMNIEVF